jgi:ribosomal-protein-serine acetyltransferase
MIRLIQHTDAERIWALVELNREYLRKWLPWLDGNISIDDTRKFITDSLTGYEQKTSMVHVIVDDQVCGICGFNTFNPSIKAGFIGYWISKDHQGKGLVTEACRALEDIGFGSLGLNKIEIHVANGNVPSRKVAERLGYIETGSILDAEWLYDHYVDHVIYCKRNPINNKSHRTPASNVGATR